MGVKRAANMAAAGASKQEIKAANPGLSSKEIKAAINPAPSVRDAIRDAGSNGNISKNELLKISESTGKEVDQVVRQLDKVNDRRSDNSKAPIGIGSAAYNSLLKTPTSKTMWGKSMSDLGLSDPYAKFGSGAIGQAIRQGKGTTDWDGTSVKGTGKAPKGQQVIGSYNGTPQLQIKPQNNVNAGYYGPGPGPYDGMEIKPSDPNGPGPWAPGTGAGAGGGEAAPLLLPEEKPDPIALSSGTGSTVDGTATSFRRKRSTARAAGLTSRGTGQFRNTLKVGSASGVNIGM
jgi:hypothetical protein